MTVGTSEATAGAGEVLAPCLAIGAAGTALLAAAAMTPFPGLVTAAGAVLIATAVLSGVARVRGARRTEALGLALTALVPVVGRSGRIAARRWTGGWVGHPRKITVVYESSAVSDSPDFLPAVSEALRLRLEQDYKVVKHHPRRCRIQLQAVAHQEREEQEVQRKTVRAARELLGPTARVKKVEQDDNGVLVRFHVSHQAGVRLAAAGYRARVERVVSTIFPGRWRALWDLERDEVVFEQRPALPESVWVPLAMPAGDEDLLSNYEAVRIPYAVDEDGREISWAPARVPQMLITGQTGSGKTATTHGLLGKVTQFTWPVWICDGKRVEFLRFRDWPNVQIVATTVPHQVAVIHRAWEVMQERYRLMEEEGVRVEEFEPLVLILDEWAEFVSELLDWYSTVKTKGDPPKPPTLREEASLARKARTARIHIIKTMQRPDVSLLGGQGGEARSNFGQRIAVGRQDPQGAFMMWESTTVGVSIPRGLRQRSTTTDEDGQPVEVQCYRFPSMYAPIGSEEGDLRETLRPAINRHPRLVIGPPATVGDLDDTDELSVEIPPTFWGFAEAPFFKASDRPDLDPLARARDLGQRAGSPAVMSILGLEGNGPGRYGSGGTRERIGGMGEAAEDRPLRDDEVDLALEGLNDFEPPVSRSPFDLAIGDLIEIEPGTWAALDADPEDDPSDPGSVALSWCADDGTEGVLSLDADSPVPSRRSLFVGVG